MSKSLLEVKQKLLQKYERLAKNTKSKAKKKHFAHKASTYRMQVAQLGSQ